MRRASDAVDLRVLGAMQITVLDWLQLVGAHQAQVHDVADVEIINPVVQLFEAERVPDGDLELLDLLDGFDLL